MATTDKAYHTMTPTHRPYKIATEIILEIIPKYREVIQRNNVTIFIKIHVLFSKSGMKM